MSPITGAGKAIRAFGELFMREDADDIEYIDKENTDDTEGKIDYDVSITSDGKLQTKFSLQSRASTTDRSVLKQTEDFVADIINALFIGILFSLR